MQKQLYEKCLFHIFYINSCLNNEEQIEYMELNLE